MKKFKVTLVEHLIYRSVEVFAENKERAEEIFHDMGTDNLEIDSVMFSETDTEEIVNKKNKFKKVLHYICENCNDEQVSYPETEHILPYMLQCANCGFNGMIYEDDVVLKEEIV